LKKGARAVLFYTHEPHQEENQAADVQRS